MNVGDELYFGSGSSVLTLDKAGAPQAVAPIFGTPILGADCSYVYWSNEFDNRVHRYDVTLGLTSDVAKGLIWPSPSRTRRCSDMVIDRDYVYVIAVTGEITRIRK
ncbi:hypothetical protein BH11MYX4_BH11MYX4_14220 [soil metagenome]